MAIIQGTAARVATQVTGGTQTTSFSQTGGMRVTAFDAPYMDAVREGRRFGCGPNAAITGIAPSAVILTTAPQWSLWNASTTKTMFFTCIGMGLTSVAATGVTGVSVSYCLYTLPASVTMYAGMGVTNLSATSTATSALVVKTAVTVTTPAAPVWVGVAQSPHIGAAATVNMLVANHQVFGGVCVPPLSALGLSAYSPTATGLFAPNCEWIELETTQF